MASSRPAATSASATSDSAAAPSFANYRRFLTRALRNPSAVGAVAPSSPHLARDMAQVVPSSGRPVVVEIGPGTGALSSAVAQRLPAGGRHLAIELDTGMADYLQRSQPSLEVVRGDAVHLRELLREAGVDSVDAVISGLPWAIFAPDAQREILREVGEILTPEGALTTFAYVHALGMSGARQFRGRLGRAFDEVVTTRTVWRNLPPARTYVCRRPTSAA